jgi:hypothetical protein
MSISRRGKALRGFIVGRLVDQHDKQIASVAPATAFSRRARSFSLCSLRDDLLRMQVDRVQAPLVANPDLTVSATSVPATAAASLRAKAEDGRGARSEFF